MGGVQKWFFTKGQKVGELTYLGEAPFHIQRNGRRVRKCKWQCRCGKKFSTTLPLVLRTSKKPVRSCGCIKSEAVRKSSTKHGLCGTKIYSIWTAMKDRCYNDRNPKYYSYGGRGIKVFPVWKKSVVKFHQYVSNLPGYEGGKKGQKRNKLSLDRIDNNKGYRPGNLRWASPSQQGLNTGLKITNTSGYRNIVLAGNIWMFSFIIDGHRIYKSGGKDLDGAVRVRNKFVIDNNLDFPIYKIKRKKKCS